MTAIIPTLPRAPVQLSRCGYPKDLDVRDSVAGCGTLANGLVEADAFQPRSSSHGLVVLHVETDVVEHAPSARRLLRVGLGEPELTARSVDDRRAVTSPGLATKGLRVPGLGFGNLGFQQDEVDMLMPGSASIAFCLPGFRCPRRPASRRKLDPGISRRRGRASSITARSASASPDALSLPSEVTE